MKTNRTNRKAAYAAPFSFLRGAAPGAFQKIGIRLLLLTAVALIIVPEASAFQAYLDTFNATYPGAVGTRIDTCFICHINGNVGGLRTSYGNAFFAMPGRTSQDLINIQGQDSDVDGFTNIAEINAQTFPGNVSDFPLVLTNITVQPASANLIVGGNQTFTATARDQLGNPIVPSPVITWSSNNTTVGNVNAAGMFTASAVGIARINATNGSVVGNATVTVLLTSPGGGGGAGGGGGTFAPPSPVNSISNASVSFGVTSNQTVNVTWLINGTQVQKNPGVTSATYTNLSAAVGTWNVTAVLNNTNGTTSLKWDWVVTQAPAPITGIAVPLTGAQANKTSNATGNGIFVLDTAANTLTFLVSFTGLQGIETIAHIHRGAPGVDGPPISPPVPIGSPTAGVFVYPEVEEANILNGSTYFNVHSTAFPAGEIRGQITPTTAFTLELAPNPPVSGSTLSVTVRKSGNAQPNVLVNFVLNNSLPIYTMTNALGIVVFKPDFTGPLVINATTPDGITLASVSAAVAAPVVVDPGSGGGGNAGNGGSGGGGGGGASGEKTTNIDVIEKYDLQISKDVLTPYRFTHAKNPIRFVNITGNTSLGIITASIEVLKSTSTLVKMPPEGLTYMNMNIWVGTTGFANEKNIKQALIKFRVNNDWLERNGIPASEVKMVRWDGSKWIALETKFVEKDGISTTLEAETRNFSPFAIMAKKPIIEAKPLPVTTTPKPAAPEVTAPPAAAVPTKGTPGFVVFAAIGALGAIYILYRKRR